MNWQYYIHAQFIFLYKPLINCIIYDNLSLCSSLHLINTCYIYAQLFYCMCYMLIKLLTHFALDYIHCTLMHDVYYIYIMVMAKGP